MPLAFFRRDRRRPATTGFAALSDRRGTIAVVFAITAPILLLLTMGVLDLSQMNSSKTSLQQATDAAGLAVSAATSKNPNATESSLQTLAQNVLAADFNSGGPVTVTDFHVCTPQAADCTTGAGVTMTENTVAISTRANAPCYAPPLVPGICTGPGVSAPLTVSNVSTIGIPANIQINLLLDTSGSMIVGSTPSDVTAVENWNNNATNWATVHYSGDSSQSRPCAFACHDNGPSSSGVNGPTTSGSATSNMQMGLTNAHAAGATTRFDVMITAASNLITHVQNKITGNAQLAKNGYYFNISTMADALTNVYTATTANDWTDAQNAINNKIFVGLDTHISTVLQAFTNTVGQGGTGATASSPLKFVIIVTDGLQSDFYADFYSCTGYTQDTAWASQASQSPGWYGYYETGCYATPMPTSWCQTMKNNGITVAVLETPYVPLTGQDPNEQYLYETWVRHTIYPNGPNTASTVSTALQACASPGYYYQASTSDPTTISSGFVTLTDKFLAGTAYIRQ